MRPFLACFSNLHLQEDKQRVCGAYLTAVERYKELVPKAFFDSTIGEIEKAFLVSTLVIQNSANVGFDNYDSQCAPACLGNPIIKQYQWEAISLQNLVLQ